MKKFAEPIMVTKSFLPPKEEYVKEISKIWEGNWLTNQGPIHNSFKEKVSNYLKIPNVTLFVNGHLALDIAIKALKLTGNVITTPFTFASTTHAIVMNGLTPKFCDISMENYTIDVAAIEQLIDEETSAIIPVHVFGNPCDVMAIEAIAKRHNLKVIYDAAHVFGVEVDGRGIGTFGDVAMFSLHATKVFNSIEGGLLAYNNHEYEHLFDLYKNFGITGPEHVEAVGLNAKMNEFQAAMGVVNLNYVENEIAQRKQVAQTYRTCLKDVTGIKCLEDMEGVRHNYAYFPILVNEDEFGIDRNQLYEKLKEYNVFSRKYFYPLVTEFSCYKDDFQNYQLPNAQYVGNHVLTLPMYGSLDLTIVTEICKLIQSLHK